MAITVKNEYKVRFVDETEKPVIAADMLQVCKTYEAPGTPIAQITRVRPNVESVTEDPIVPVAFIATVTPQGAIDAGCVASPNAYTVDNGEEVIFQAVAVAGFTFDGWYSGTTKITSSPIVKMPVVAPAIAGQTVQFLAKFVAVGP